MMLISHAALRPVPQRQKPFIHMPKLKLILLCLISFASGPLGSSGAPAAAYDLTVCAAINRNYVIGSKLVTLNGLFRRTDAGEFVHFGLNFPHVFNAAYDPRNREELYLATLNGAVVSRDGGKTLRIATSWDMTEAKDICLDLNAPDQIFLALPDGIAASTDRGATWSRREKGLPDRGKYTQTIEVDRTRAGRVLAGCESGIYLTEDAGRRWRRVMVSKATVTDVQQSPHDPKVWMATTQSDGVQISSDRGVTWKKLGGVPSEEALYNIAFDGTREGRVAVSSWTYGVWTTEDGGKTWVSRNDGLPDGHCVFRVGIDPGTGRLYAGVYQTALYHSDDFGRTWIVSGLEGSTITNFVFTPKAAH